MIVTCDKCKKEVQVSMYFYDTNICKTTAAWDLHEYYEARCWGKTICPCCGTEINRYYSRPVENSDIIKLAVGEER